MPQYIIPGKAYEALSKCDLNDAQKKLIAKGEKRNKGRGYRVFINLTPAQARDIGNALAEFAALHTDATQGQVVAYNTAIERLGGQRQESVEKETEMTIPTLPDASHLEGLIQGEEAHMLDFIEATFAGKRGKREMADYVLLRGRYREILRGIEYRAFGHRVTA